MDSLIAAAEYTVIGTAGIVAAFKIYMKAEKWFFSRQTSKPARSK